MTVKLHTKICKILFKNKNGKKRFSIPNKCNQQKKETTGDFFMHLFRSK